ncbi:hypothetical protein [Leifsonia soli]|uniref:Uncharacterized protein n=1 Tax=Leifsonia soli TaxID=582665 RepID=A0A852T019_9MICO|nr:hypothetical protein [Leifsonia soli]NYD74876.1 hypothetical protein [Leifsonia soli]
MSRRIVELSTEVMRFQRAVDPVKDVLRGLRDGPIGREEDEGLRDAGGPAAERRGEEDLGLGRHPVHPDPRSRSC